MADLSNSLSFLDTVSGYAQDLIKGALGSAAEPIRLAVIDPAYVATTYPTTLPRVTFEGEDTVTDKRYPVTARSYFPGPGDRVVMLPIGHTYTIAGVVAPAQVAPVFHQPATVTAVATTSNTSFVSLSGGPIATIDLRAGQYAEIIVSCQEFSDTVGANGVIMSFRSTGASGTTEAVDTDGHETGHVNEWTPMERTSIWGPAGSGGSHSFESRYRVIGSTTGNWKNRRIIAKAL